MGKFGFLFDGVSYEVETTSDADGRQIYRVGELGKERRAELVGGPRVYKLFEHLVTLAALMRDVTPEQMQTIGIPARNRHRVIESLLAFAKSLRG